MMIWMMLMLMHVVVEGKCCLMHLFQIGSMFVLKAVAGGRDLRWILEHESEEVDGRQVNCHDEDQCQPFGCHDDDEEEESFLIILDNMVYGEFRER